MAIEIRRMTADEFDQFAELPENADSILEFINGEIIDVPSNAYVSTISMQIGHKFGTYLDQNDIGHITGEAGGFMVNGERYAPDVAFISYARQPQIARKGYNPNPPDLAVEVDYPSSVESRRRLGYKIINYLLIGTIVWVVYPDAQEVEVYTPGQPAKVIGIDGILTGDPVLPGFSLAVKDIFK